jgi:hypothetical protein
VSAQLESIRKKINKENRNKLTRQYTTGKHIRIALKAYNEALPNAKEMRHEHLMESAKAAAKTDNKAVEQHYTHEHIAIRMPLRLLARITSTRRRQPQSRKNIKTLEKKL